MQRWFGVFFLFLFGVWLIPAEGQEKEKPNVTFGKPQDLEIELVTIPDAVATGGKPSPTGTDTKTSQEGRWLRIDVPFATEKRVTPEIRFKFYLEGYEVQDNGAGGKDTERYVVLTGETAYRDVPQGSKHFAGVFLPPSSTFRFAGLKPNGEADWSGRKMNLRVEAEVQGTPVAEGFDLQADKEKGPSGRGGKKDPDWHKSADAQEVAGALLPVQETPFWPKDYKRYPQPKKP